MSTHNPPPPSPSPPAPAAGSPVTTAPISASPESGELVAQLKRAEQRARAGGAPKYHEKNTAEGKLFCRERLRLLFDQDGADFVEDGLLANHQARDLPADGVVTGIGRVHGRPVAVMANDSTVKAGSWGQRTVEKIIRIQETAGRLRIPLIYLVDSAGARITDQLDMFPGRRHAGRIFNTQVQLSGSIPQICLLFGPSAAGGAYIPAFCDVVFMVEHNASMYLGSPRMAEMVIGEKTTLEEMGGARMHCETSGCGDLLAKTEEECIKKCRDYLGYLPPAPRAPRPRRPPPRPASRAPTASASTTSCPRTTTSRSTSCRSSRRLSMPAASSRSRSCSPASW